MNQLNDNDPVLKLMNVSKSFGSLVAVNDISFEVKKGEIFGIAGPNGAGKTTLFNCITATPFNADSGNIFLEDKNIKDLQPYNICQLGIARTFQKPESFKSFTIEENVEIGLIFGKKYKDPDPEDKIRQILEFVNLYDIKDEQADDLSLYEIKMLMLASALTTDPKILMLDEPVGGLNKSEINLMRSKLEELKKKGLTIIIVEHIMTFLMNCSDRLLIMDAGKKIAEGLCSVVANHEEVIRVYFGTKIV